MALRLPAAILFVVTLAWLPAAAQVTYERLMRAVQEPQNWLTYSGGYASHRYSPCARITPATVANLEQRWVLQATVVGTWQATPVVVDGVMYVTQRLNDVVSLDARTGRPYWLYHYNTPADQKAC